MIKIREAVPQDIESICAFDIVEAHRDVDFGGHVTMPEFITKAVSSGQCLVATVEDEITGVIGLDYTFFGCGFISILIIQEKYRRQGFATQLIQRVESLCRTQKLFTSTNESNRPMQALLVKLGYRPSGVINNLDNGDPEIVYYKKLSDSR